MRLQRKIIFYAVSAVFFMPLFVLVFPSELASAATTVEGNSPQPFIISGEYEFSGRIQLQATLRVVGEKARYFIDDDYWYARDDFERQAIIRQTLKLAEEFDNRIYPMETAFWGQENLPGIDNDPKVAVLLANLIDTAGGYFDTAHQFSKTKFPESNEKDMVYLNIRSLRNEKRGFAFLAHEFQHLIALNQKNLLRRANDDIWLNELRSEYSISLLGYNDSHADSNLKRRLSSFLGEPSDSLTEWANKAADYAQVVFFAEYLVEHFGSNLLKESLHSGLGSIASLEQVLRDSGYGLDFGDVFLRWSAANVLGDILLSSDYGYFREGLRQELRAPATRTVSNLREDTVFSITEAFKDWQAKWVWISGLAPGNKNVLKLNFSGEKEDLFRGAAISFYQNGRREVNFFDLNQPGPDDLFFDFNPGLSGQGLEKIILIPVKMEKKSEFTGQEPLSDLIITMERVSEITSPSVPILSVISTPIPIPTPISTPTPQPTQSVVRPADFGLKEGDFIRAEGDIDVYIINDFGFKRLVLNPQICLLYGHLGARGCFGAVKTVSPRTRDAFKTSLFFTDGDRKDGRVYFLELTGTDSAALHFVNMSGDDFVQQGGNFSAVFLFNTREKNTYPLGKDLKNL